MGWPSKVMRPGRRRVEPGQDARDGRLARPDSPTSATISARVDDEGDVVGRVQRPARAESPDAGSAATGPRPSGSQALRTTGLHEVAAHRVALAVDELGRHGRGTRRSRRRSAARRGSPAGGVDQRRRVAGDAQQRLGLAEQARGTPPSAPGSRGAAGRSKTRAGRARARRSRPAYITARRSEKWLTTLMSWVTKMTEKPKRWRRFSHLAHQRALGHDVEAPTSARP